MNRRDFLKTSAAGIGVALCHASLVEALTADSAEKTLILGGTAFACGAACAHPEKVVVLERGIHLVPEFALTNDSFLPGEPATEAGRALFSRLQAEGLLYKGRLRQAALPDFFSCYMGGTRCPLLLNAELAACTRTQGGFRVTLCGIDGLASFTVARILDTTAEGWQDAGRDCIAAKSFSAVLRGRPQGDLAALCGEGVSLCEGTEPDETIFRVALPAAASCHEARLRLHSAWEAMKAKCPELKLAAESPAIACFYRKGEIQRTEKNGLCWIPSAQYANLMAAFEKGFSCVSV